MPTPPDGPAGKATGFLNRWSDRKARAGELEPGEPREPAPEAPLNGQDHTADGIEPRAPVTEADLENLSYDSDYTKFMGKDVPEALRRHALRQLWRSDPILANVDGLCDYNEDYTDAALVVKTLQTAHRVGQGYLTDEEVAANRARGQPRAEQPDSVAAVDDQISDDETTVAATEEVAMHADGLDPVATSAPAEPATKDASTQNDYAGDAPDKGATAHKPESA